MSATGLVTHAFATRHDTGSGHPERAARVESVLERLRDSGLATEMQALEGPLCTLADLALVHDEKYIDRARRAGFAQEPLTLRLFRAGREGGDGL